MRKRRFEFFLDLRSGLWNGEAKGVAKRLAWIFSPQAVGGEKST
jgi:hypothetical protein